MNTASTVLPEKIVDDFHLDWHSKTDSNRKYSQLSKPEIEYNMMKEMCAALGMHTC